MKNVYTARKAVSRARRLAKLIVWKKAFVFLESLIFLSGSWFMTGVLLIFILSGTPYLSLEYGEYIALGFLAMTGIFGSIAGFIFYVSDMLAEINRTTPIFYQSKKCRGLGNCNVTYGKVLRSRRGMSTKTILSTYSPPAVIRRAWKLLSTGKN